MSEKETLSQMLRRLADVKATSCYMCCGIMGVPYSTGCAGDCTSWIRKITDMIEREYLPMPRYEDGELVEVGSVCEWGVVESVEVTASDGGWGNWLIRCGEDGMPCEGTLNQRVERGVLVEGKQVLKGDALWFGDEKVTVVSVANGTHILTDHTVTDADGNEIIYPFEPCELSWERPDSMERIREDALKNTPAYWECNGSFCTDCPVKVDGKKPTERYGVSECLSAAKLDLIRRTEEVCGR